VQVTFVWMLNKHLGNHKAIIGTLYVFWHWIYTLHVVSYLCTFCIPMCSECFCECVNLIGLSYISCGLAGLSHRLRAISHEFSQGSAQFVSSQSGLTWLGLRLAQALQALQH